MADLGIDLDGVLDWPDPEVLASGTKNLANALARMLLMENGALADVGDDEPFETLNLRDWYGARPSAAEVQALNTQMGQILAQSDRVSSVSAVATFANGALSVAVNGQGAAGPFSFILAIASVNSVALQVNQ